LATFLATCFDPEDGSIICPYKFDRPVSKTLQALYNPENYKLKYSPADLC
jgi:hypothetical protein